MSTVACGDLAGRGSRVSSTWRRPPPVSTMSVPSAPRPSRAATHASVRMPLPLISAMPPSALKSSISASAPSVPGLHDDQAVGADAGVAVAERGAPAREVHGHSGVRRAEPRPHEEVVAGGVQLGQPDGSHALQLARRAGRTEHGFSGRPEPADAGVAPEPHALAAGELPGAHHDGLERGVERRLVPVEVVEDLPVADGLGGGAGERAAVAAAPRTSSTRPASRMACDPRRRCAASSTSRGSHTPGDAHREHGRRRTSGCRRRTTRTGGR